MSKYDTRDDLASKIDNEGVHYFILEYGAVVEDMPDDETAAAFQRVLDVAEPYAAAVDAFTQLLPDW